MPELALVEEGKKFMWDGKEYDSEADAKAAADEYAAKDFEVHQISEEGKFLVYTRKVVTEVVVEGSP